VLDKAKANLVVLLCHRNADPDALGSAYAFSQLLNKMQSNLEVEVAPAQGASKISRELIKAIQMKITSSPRIEDADVIFLLDTSTIEQLGPWKPRVKATEKPIIVIDHHAIHPETEKLAQLTIIHEDAASTCEIVYQMYKEAKIQPSKKTAQALFWGIAFDTKHFLIANSTTFKTIAELVDYGVDVKEALKLLRTSMEPSERISRVKAAKRLRLIRMGAWLITVSHVSSFQSSAARALISLGAHVAVVCGVKDGAVHISMRSSGTFYEETGIHLGRDIAKPLGEYVKGMGGGHSTAAGASGEGKFSIVSDKCITLFQEKLMKSPSSQT
jgi:phosphoesterase RecJ-like protein